MSISPIRFLKQAFLPRPGSRGRQGRYRPRLELLEDRRLLSVAALDPTFGQGGLVATGVPGSVFPPSVSGAAVQRDGKIVVAETAAFGQGFVISGGVGVIALLKRVNADGTEDTSFVSPPVHVSPTNPIAPVLGPVQNDGKVLWSQGATLFRSEPAGPLDPSFGSGGKLDTPFIPTAITVQGDGRILVAGSSPPQFAPNLNPSGDPVFAVARYNSDGSPDTSFGSGGVALTQFPASAPGEETPTATASALAVQADGKILVGGTFGGQFAVGPNSFLPQAAFAVARYNADGTPDTSFHGTGVVVEGGDAAVFHGYSVFSGLLVQPDGRILVSSYSAGAFDPAVLRSALTRYTPAGAFDPTFNGTGAVTLDRAATGHGFTAISLRPDGTIVAAGLNDATSVRPALKEIDLFSGDGRLTASLPLPLAGGTLAGLALQADDKVLLWGSFSAATLPAGVTPTLARIAFVAPRVATAADAGGGPNVKVMDADTGATVLNFMAYDPAYTGGVRVAVGDVNGDGVDDIVTAPGPGGGPDVHVYDGRSGDFLRQFFAYDMHFTGGVYVAAGDVNGDGFADIICGADAGGGPNVTVFSGKDGSRLQSFFAYDMAFTGGVRVAAGDVDGDGFADLVCGAGAGGGPNVTVFSGKDGTRRASFFAYDRGFSAGIYVAAGDVDGDGRAEVVAGAGAGGGPNISVFRLATDGIAALASFFAYDAAFGGGVRVATQRPGTVLATPGPGGGPDVGRFDAAIGRTLDHFLAYDAAFTGGLFVAAG